MKKKMTIFKTLRVLLPVIAISIMALGCGQSVQPEQADAESPAISTSKGGQSPETSEVELPKDIYPETGSRLPLVKREELDDFGKEYYDNFEEDIKSSGPRRIRMHSPRVAEYMTRGNQFLRYEAGMEPRLQELTILVAAREMDAQYEWTAHESSALKEGLDQGVIDVVKYRKPITGLQEEEAVIIQLGREVFEDHKVSSETFARALEQFGKKKLVEIVTLMGHYTATAILLITFDQQLRPGQQPGLPIP